MAEKKGLKNATKGGKPVKKQAKQKEPAERIPGLNVGLKTGKRVVMFVNDTLIDNKRRMYSDPRTMLSDDELLSAFGREFPKRESFQEASSYRNYFNGGLAAMGDPPNSKAPEEWRLYGKDRALRLWAQGKYRPKCGACPEDLKKKILKVKEKEGKEDKKKGSKKTASEE